MTGPDRVPEQPLAGPRRHGGRLVACLGDSLTAGRVSSDYVALLQSRWQAHGVRFANHGVDGDLAFNVAARVDQVIALRPDVVTVLVGTNDVNARYDDAWLARYRRHQRLPVPPTREWYGEQLDAILARLRGGTDAVVAVLDLPPLGEDLGSRMNQLVEEYNLTLRDTAIRHRVPCLPLHDNLVAALPPAGTPPPYLGRRSPILAAAARHLLLRQGWDEISRRNGLAVLTDHLHLNDRAAAVVADLVGDLLRRSGFA